MEIKLYNTLTRKKEVFKPIKGKKVGIYACGPTVYDAAHIGNLRTYIFEDILKRTLLYNGYKIKHVMNITDIDDKIINKMRIEHKTLKKTTEPFIKTFFSDLKKLNIKEADVYPKATATIKEIIQLISILLKNGFAYKGNDGSIYFNVLKFADYGQLSKLKQREIKNGARINSDEYTKKTASDFVLWKNAKPNEQNWNAPFGKGRPGWHIECSAMSMKYLGNAFEDKNFYSERSRTIDIHCGAVDLIFPHHENEIAQSESATGKKFVNYWVEGEHLLVDDKKMSKSLGNFYTLTDIEKHGFNPVVFRYLMLNTHYRAKLNFTWKSLEDSQNALNNIYNAIYRYKTDQIRQTKNVDKAKTQYKNEFLKAVNDDLNMPRALAVFFTVIDDTRLSNRQKLDILMNFDEIFGLGLDKIQKIKIPGEIKKLINNREQLRKEKNWREADKIREELEKKGWTVKDTVKGPVAEKIK